MGFISLYILESVYQVLPKSCSDFGWDIILVRDMEEIGFFIILGCPMHENDMSVISWGLTLYHLMKFFSYKVLIC